MDPDYLKFLRKNRTMVISSNGVKLWLSKVYYALDRGFIFLIEKGSLSLQNIKVNNEVAFEIDDNRLRIFIQGRGKVEILGEPSEFNRERGILVYKVPEDQVFINLQHVLIARLIPEQIRVTDMRVRFIRKDEKFDLEELKERPNPYFRIIRPWSFFQSIAAYIAGIALSGRLLIIPAILGAIALVMAHGAFNTISEYFDYKQRIDIETSLSGARVLVDKLISDKQAFRYFVLLFSISLAIGLYLLLENIRIWPFIAIGILGGLLYGVPKIGFKKLALGDLSVLLVWSFGIFLGGYSLMGKPVGLDTIILSLPIGLLTVDILHANNWRDIKYDLSRGVRTVANILGEKGSKVYYLILLTVPYAILMWYSAMHQILEFLIILISVPFLIKLITISNSRENINFGRLDQLTAKFTLYFGILEAIIFILNSAVF